MGVGAEQGVGAAVARRFAKEGHHVLVAGRTPAKIEQVVRTIASAGGSAEAVLTDATRELDEICVNRQRVPLWRALSHQLGARARTSGKPPWW